MELDDESIKLEPGMAIMIKHGTHHAGKGNFKALIIGVPPLKDEDEILS